MKPLIGLACLVFAFVILDWTVAMAPLNWYTILVSGLLIFLSVAYSVMLICSDSK